MELGTDEEGSISSKSSSLQYEVIAKMDDIEKKMGKIDIALHAAAESGNLDDVLKYNPMLNNNTFDIDAKDQDGKTALLKAAANGHANVVQLLLHLGADAKNTTAADEEYDFLDAHYHEYDQLKITPLWAASSNGHKDVVAMLLANTGIEVNQPNGRGETPLWVASEKGYIDVVELLVAAPGIEVNKARHYYNANGKGETPIFVASSNGHKEVVAWLLANTGIDVNQPNGRGETPLWVASIKGYKAVVALLLAVPGIEVNRATVDGESSLWIASSNRHKEVVTLLLAANGIDVNQANGKGETPLFVASEKGITELVEMFLAVPGIDVNVATTGGVTPLWIATSNGYKTVVTLLLNSNGIEVNLANRRGESPLFVASEKGLTEIVEMLLAVPGIDVNLATKDGDTPLHIADMDIFVILFNHGADYTIKNKGGNTCFDMFTAKNKLISLTKIQLTLSSLEAYNYSLWFVVVQIENATDEDLFATLLAMVEPLLSSHPTLATAKDVDGRAAVDVASKAMKLIIQSVLLWHGRYRITESRPEHISATCYVFKAVDEHTIDKETGHPIKVALKLMRLKTQFLRELSTRDKGFNHEFVMNVLQTYPEIGSTTMDSWPDEVVGVEADATGQLTKANAEKFYLLVMPLADRNLFVSLKQERWAGKNMEEVRHVFVQLVHCVDHMHEKGVLHADLKPLNIVRTGGQWKLIDLDAACAIGKEPMGHKTSSAYIPPEAIHVDEKSFSASVRSAKGGDVWTAHASFDVWSLGCILYQICTTDVKPLFQCGQDDNLVGVRKGVDNLFSLAEWSPELKAEKLTDVPDKLARNLLSQMLHKDPLQRPSLARVLAHPFLSGIKVARLIGEKPKYDVFLSYRVASDAQHVEKLYNLLTAQGFKVYLDKLCLLPGVDWEQGFCEGLVSSRAFVPLLSRDAINHPDKAWQNFSKLMADSNCDNVFLEHRLAVELQGLGLIEKIFPIFIGNLDAMTSEYSHYFGSGCHPSLPEVTVKSVDEKVRHHMESQALGPPLEPDRTVRSVVGAITACQGAFIVGPADVTFAEATASIAKMLTDVPVTHSPRGGTHVHQTLFNAMDNKTLVAEIDILMTKVDRLVSDVESLQVVKGRQKSALASLTGDVSHFATVEALAAHVQALLQGES